ncbi:hypothetical protein C1H46_000463 [Malus baccata]|uniref:ADP-ribosyl cyclase/cyclic ADP-ribose hydrolase n=1 Tax=Malus baccata TaxID=106549 RepID=A0A540NS24_MALBA|nr:hypothetical protein C1H46_000463 [Malus baccata]
MEKASNVMDIASSSSSAADNPPRREKYDVFISFRGEDPRLGITSHLHAALLQKKIETYIDDNLQSGEEIGPALLEAIEKSTISVIIFSQNYASSSWCLDELVHILKCNNKEGGMVIPVFYDIDPSDVRKQHGSYADAFAELEKRFANSIDKVHKWRDALTTAANLSGFDYSNKSGTEANLIQKVVDHIWAKMCRESSCNLKGFVGIESRIEQIESLLGIHLPDACITVGIWGMGGIGKTTLADAVFRRHSSKFEASCFLKNVRENSEQAGGLDHLEKTLFMEILKEEVSLPVGSTFQERLSRTKVLIVLDDVSDSLQMDRLAGDHLRYGSGSRIIITSRDRGKLGLTGEEAKIYKVEGLKSDDALQLFCLRAFKNNGACRTDFKELAKEVVAYAGYVPLALTVLGSFFFNCKSKEEWEDEFNKLKRFPCEDIQKVLRISYDKLGDNEKDIFLDIACFHKGKSVVEVKRMLDVRGFFAPSGVRILIEMSLISFDSNWGMETIEMHDLLQEMGRKIVQEQGIKDPGKRSRLFNDEDVYRVLRSNKETPNVEVIQVNWNNAFKYQPLKCADFKKISNLIMLIVVGGHKFITSLDLPDSLRCLYWDDYPFESLPSNFCPENLVELHLPFSKVKKLCKEGTAVEMLPSSIENLNGLQDLNLNGCNQLKELPSSIGNLNRLQDLRLRSCEQLKDVPTGIYSLTNLKRLNLRFCRRLENLPSISVGFLSLEELDLSYSGILEIPASIKQASRLSKLDLSSCEQLQSIPELPVLCNVAAQGCTSLKIVSSSRTALTQGKEIPNWFSYQNEGSSVDIEFCPDWFRTGLFGFALSLVLSGCPHLLYQPRRVRANFIVKFLGESHELFSSKYIFPDRIYHHGDGQHHVHVWNEAFRSEEVGKNCSPDVYKLAKEASVVFFCRASNMKVERCGICPLYAEDAEKFKFGHVSMSRGPKVEEETRQDDDSKGGESRDEPLGSGSSDESEAHEGDDHGSEVSGTEDDSSDESEAN